MAGRKRQTTVSEQPAPADPVIEVQAAHKKRGRKKKVHPEIIIAKKRGRKSSLTPKQWADIEIRINAGESLYAIAKAYKVDRSTIARHFDLDNELEKDTANKLLNAQLQFNSLTFLQKQRTISILDSLKCATLHNSDAAVHNAMVASHLSRLATAKASKLTENTLTPEALDEVKNLIDVSTAGSKTGLSMLQIAKEHVGPNLGNTKQEKTLTRAQFRADAKELLNTI